MSDIQKTHYSFGTDDWRAVSTYFQDFGSSQISFYKPPPLRPPSPAQVLPTPNRSDEKAKWLCSSKRDFLNYIGDVNRDTYLETLKEYNQVKEFSTVSRPGVWNANEKLPPLSRSTLDYRPPSIATGSASATPTLLAKIKSKNRRNRAYSESTLRTEAMHAFQWPTRKRMRPVPLVCRTKLPAVK
ncbi:uncharacterized protein LOC110462143 [Mizuhopecten yessoensis]|uniref:Uncharacterized protein n=1 Tax=Mizuhopecten yessoensis TaxID=6573 RepID=A0A210PYT1_MIZYE|nr:uncharacterized protein LOC110462143 [Mizuhopecten yessoensis]OWF41650.1 hypothetical protein KP79_PYT22058 [Mizuhopecten yessoensis]